MCCDVTQLKPLIGKLHIRRLVSLLDCYIIFKLSLLQWLPHDELPHRVHEMEHFIELF